VQDPVEVAGGVGDGDGVEQVELLACRDRQFVARRLHERPQRTAEHASSAGDEQPHAQPLRRLVAPR
jgi:hypothetical protein